MISVKNTILSLSLLAGIATASSSYASNFASTMDDWLNPTLMGKKQEVAKVLASLDTTRNPQSIPTAEYGFSHAPGNKFDWQFLCVVSLQKKGGKKPLVLDLGCGLGHMAIMSMLAGAHVDMVDFKETVTQANANVFSKTKSILGYTAKEAKDHYRAFPYNLNDSVPQKWMDSKHTIALCKDVVHFFTESEIQLLASRIFENLVEDGCLYLCADTPLISQETLDFYNSRLGKVLCPGLGIYTKVTGSKGLGLGGAPVALDEKKHTVRPGLQHVGRFMPDGTVQSDDKVYHTARNHFLTNELGEIFKRAGFKISYSFYIGWDGAMLVDKLPEIGKPSKACVLLTKPITQSQMSEADVLKRLEFLMGHGY
jgi:SAM-dependent methyltransferase